MEAVMRRPRAATEWARVLAVGIPLVAAACERTDRIAGPVREDVRARQASLAMGAARPGGAERLSLPRFGAIEARAATPIRSGEPIALSISVRAGEIATAEAEISVFLPEVAIWQRKQWTSGHTQPGAQFPAQATWRTGFVAGQVVSQQTSITIPLAGYYRLIVQVKAGPGEPAIVNGHIYTDIAQKEVWLEVNERGGQVLDRFPPTAAAGPGVHLAAGSRGMPGPRRDRRDVGIQKCLPEEPSCQPPGQQRIFGFLLYTNSRMPFFASGLPRATVALFNSSAQVIAGPVLTTESGYFEFTVTQCPTAWTPYTIGAYTGNSVVTVREVGYGDGTSSSDIVGARNVYVEDCNNQSDVGALSNEQAEAFDNLNESAVASRTFFGGVANRPKVTARVRPDLPGGGGYSPGSADSIVLFSGALYGTDAVYIAGHEYGHAVHEKALGGYSNYAWYGYWYTETTPPRCPPLHYPYTVSPMFCAWIEGFADFHAVITRGYANPAWRVDSANVNAWWNNPSQTVPGDPQSERDGSLREGAISAFLVDVLDGKSNDVTHYATGTWYDNVQLPPAFFARLMRSCKVQHWGNQSQIGTGTWDRANGIDFLFHCLRRNRERHRDYPNGPWVITNVVDDIYRTNLFRTRRTSAILYSWPAVEYAFYWWDETEFDDYPYRGGVPYPGYEWPFHQVDMRYVMDKNLYPE
jgi:hypothetical protein